MVRPALPASPSTILCQPLFPNRIITLKGIRRRKPVNSPPIARDEKLTQVFAEMLPDNIAMQVIMKCVGFPVRPGADLTSVQAYLDL